MSSQQKRSWFFVAIFGALALGLGACKPTDQPVPKRTGAAVPVVATEITRKSMPVLARAIGRVTSPLTVSVKPQVTGNVAAVHFADGQAVKKGELLVTIDSRPFEVALEQAKASQAEAQTKANNARRQAERYAVLDKAGSASKEQAEDFKATAAGAESGVQVAAAAVKGAQLQLDYCQIRATIDGRVGKALVTAGNVVSANQTDLVVLNQIAPIEVTFAVAEQQLPAIQRGVAGGKLKVRARTSGPERQTTEGELTFLDNAVKAATGTIELKAAFANDPQTLWPGQFVNVALEVSVDVDAVVAPTAAVQNGQQGPFVFVVKADKTVEARPVVIARTVDAEAVVSSGLKGDEQVVVDGQSRLANGSKVELVPPLNNGGASTAVVQKP